MIGRDVVLANDVAGPDSIAKAKEKGCALHLIGLLTKKSSHGSIFYPLAVAEMAKELPEVYLHVIFDGRSTEPGSAPALLEELDERETGLIPEKSHEICVIYCYIS